MSRSGDAPRRFTSCWPERALVRREYLFGKRDDGAAAVHRDMLWSLALRPANELREPSFGILQLPASWLARRDLRGEDMATDPILVRTTRISDLQNERRQQGAKLRLRSIKPS
jgi:hypothetical protein